MYGLPMPAPWSYHTTTSSSNYLGYLAYSASAAIALEGDERMFSDQEYNSEAAHPHGNSHNGSGGGGGGGGGSYSPAVRPRANQPAQQQFTPPTAAAGSPRSRSLTSGTGSLSNSATSSTNGMTFMLVMLEKAMTDIKKRCVVEPTSELLLQQMI
jgi:hypothetical protein